MAEDQGQEKTEEPTQRRFEKAAEEGQVAQSADFSAGLMILTGSLFFLFAGTWFYQSLSGTMMASLSSHHLDPLRITATHQLAQTEVADLIQQSIVQLAWLIAPLVVATFAMAFLSGALMSGFKVTFKPLSPNFEKLDPIKGFQKVFSSRAIVRGVMAVVKLAVMSAVVFWLMSFAIERITQTTLIPLAESVSVGWNLTLQIAVAIAAAMVLVGLADFAFQKWKHVQDLKMTRKELKDEHKDSEGDPHLRARMRRLQREIGQRASMLAKVPEATLVVRNPTHLAIALRYNRDVDNAPTVLAKGADALALQIINVAETHGVPVVEKRPVARALFSACEVGDEIPLELYQAVAEILAYVSRQQSIVHRNRRRAG